MEKMWVVLVALLGVQWCTGLPVNKAQLKEKTLGQAPEAGVPGLDLAEYMKYWEEVSKNDPGQCWRQQLTCLPACLHP